MANTEMKGDILVKLSDNILADSPFVHKFAETLEIFQSESGYCEKDYTVIKKKSDDKQYFLSVIMRTQGKRIFPMEQALTCLLAQTNQNFELIICVHNKDLNPEANQAVLDLVDKFPTTLQNKTSVISVIGGKRGVPMNIGIDNADSEFVAFLDDDDLVTAEWVSSFEQSSKLDDSSIVRNRCVDRVVVKMESANFTPQYTKSNWLISRADNFRFIESLERNSSPLHSYAIPRKYILLYKTYVSPNIDVAEDWEYLMRNAALLGVINHPATTAIYNRWENSESSTHLHDKDTWQSTHQKSLERLTSGHVVISPEELKEIYNVFTAMYHLKDLLVAVTDNDGYGTIHEKLNKLHRYEIYLQMSGNTTNDNAFGNSIKYDLINLAKRIVKKLLKVLRIEK